MPVRVTKKKTTIPYHAHTEFNELQYIFLLLNYRGLSCKTKFSDQIYCPSMNAINLSRKKEVL